MELLNQHSVLDDLVQGILNFSGYTPILCFHESTEILCLNEDLKEVYIPISQLKEGNFVKSYKHGYRRIEAIYKKSFINDNNHVHSSMCLMPKNEHMTKDLIVTGGHSILVDNMTEDEFLKNSEYFHDTSPKIDGKQLLLAGVSEKFTTLENNKEYTVYNFCLENDGNDEARYGVWANGVLVETPAMQYLKDILNIE
jgi:hypothetical protein